MPVDLHTHILPGLDDGPETLAESIEAARAAVAAGVTLIAVTPHVREDYPTTADQMETSLATVRAALDAEGIPLDVRRGGELDIEFLERIGIEEAGRFALAGSPGYLLLEFPYSGWPLRLPSLVFDLQLAGITPILAHPERNPDVQANPERMRELVEAGALVQLTAASVDGRLGPGPQRTAAVLLASDLAHLIASDVHGTRLRGFDFRAAVEAVGDAPLADWLVEAVPAAIAAGGEIPPRPRVEPRRLLARLRRKSNA